MKGTSGRVQCARPDRTYGECDGMAVIVLQAPGSGTPFESQRMKQDRHMRGTDLVRLLVLAVQKLQRIIECEYILTGIAPSSQLIVSHSRDGRKN